MEIKFGGVPNSRGTLIIDLPKINDFFFLVGFLVLLTLFMQCIFSAV